MISKEEAAERTREVIKIKAHERSEALSPVVEAQIQSAIENGMYWCEIECNVVDALLIASLVKSHGYKTRDTYHGIIVDWGDEVSK